MMPQNIFKIHDGRTGFWQWDTKQKLIVLDDTITEVHFSNRDMTHAIPKPVYTKDGVRMCDVPDHILQLPKNLVAYAYADGMTVKSVKFAVVKRPIPDDYIADQGNDACGIESCQVNEEGHLIVVLSNGKTIDAGRVDGSDGVTFTPHISADNMLSWTNDGGLENPAPVDLNPFDEWSTLPEEGIETEYRWEFM